MFVATDSHRRFPSTSQDHVGDKTLTTNSKAHGKKGKVKFPYSLCESNNPIHLFPYMDESSKVSENVTASQPSLLASYQKFPLILH